MRRVRSIRSTSSTVLLLRATCSNERGAALIIVLMMLMLLTILGSTLLTSSTTDLQIAGNYRNNQEAFYINDRAYEFLKSEESTADVYDQLPQPDMSITNKRLPPDPVTGEVPPVSYTITNLGCQGGAPPGSGSDSDTGNAYNIYAIDISAEGPNNAAVTTLASNLYQRGKPCD